MTNDDQMLILCLFYFITTVHIWTTTTIIHYTGTIMPFGTKCRNKNKKTDETNTDLQILELFIAQSFHNFSPAFLQYIWAGELWKCQFLKGNPIFVQQTLRIFWRNGNLLPKLFWPIWEKIVLMIEKNFWNSRLKAKNLQKFWDH